MRLYLTNNFLIIRGILMTKYTGGEIIAEYLIKEGVPYAVGIPGHGNLALVDALKDRQDKIQVIQVRHEQSAIHLADGYYRASGNPLFCFTSIGPGAYNTVVGLATAFIDQSAVIAASGETHTYMFGRGVLQENERKHWADTMSVMRPITKRVWRVNRVDQLPFVMQQAFRLATTGRPGPVHIFLPMDVQAEQADVEIPEPKKYKAVGRICGDYLQVKKACELLASAERPVILAGGGVILSEASPELLELAELLGAAVITTMMGKGAFPEDHPLFAFYAGSKGTYCGNKLASSADVLLAIGCRFADETTSSYKPGVSFSIPPTKLIHVDIDIDEIGKNYPVEVGIVGDAKAVLYQIINTLKNMMKKRKYEDLPYFRTIQKLKNEWNRTLEPLKKSNKIPFTTARFLMELRKALERNAYVVGSAGHAQVELFSMFPVYEPKTHISSGGMSTMGWAIPAALGVKLAKPERQVVSVSGDGDFQMAFHELATGVQYGIPVVHCVLNNYGWLSIRDLQLDVFGKDRGFATEFRNKDGELYSPDFVKLAEAFGCYAERVEKPEEISPAIKKALKSNTDRPTVLEFPTQYEYPLSEGKTTGWWDVPIPAYLRKN
jgi:acetolactate synthase-1/2/3 large subunit